MSLTSIKAATQDGANGVPVATILNRDNNAVALQAIAQLSLKEDESAIVRTGITAADTATDLSATGFGAAPQLGDVGNAANVAIYGSCDTASATITGTLVLYDSSANVLAINPAVTLTADATRKTSASGSFVGGLTTQNIACACKVAFYVTAVSAGTWSITLRPY